MTTSARASSVVEVDELDAVVGGLLRGDERVDADDDHLHRPGPVGDGLADLAEADDPERPAAQLVTRELRALPLAASHRRVGGGRPAGDAVEQREGVLGGGDRVAGRRVDDRDPGPRRGIEVDVVDADAGPADDDEPRPGGDQLGVDLDLAADDERVVVGQDRARAPRGCSRCARRPRDGPGGARRPRGRRLRRRGPSCAGRRPARPRCPSTRARRRWAAATAAPGLDRRGPESSETTSSVLIAPRISSSVTEPRWPSRKILPVSLPWPPARTTPRRLTSVLNAFQSRPSGTCAAVTVSEACGRVGEELEAERGQAGPGRRRAGRVAGEDRVLALARSSGAGPRRPGRRPRSPG